MFPSVHHILNGAAKAFRRFPLAVLFGVLSAYCMSHSILLSHEQELMQDSLMDLLMASYLGMLGSIFFPLLGKSRFFGTVPSSLLQGLALLLFLLYYFLLPDLPQEAYPGRVFITYGLWCLALHFGIAIAPFLGVRDDERFWQYNKELFLRILTAALYTGVLFIGISIALLTIDGLFGVRIEDEYYGILLAWLAGFFNTWFFVAGIPEEPRELDPNAAYPKGLKRFTQYVLLPLVSIYLTILYGYLIKVIVQGEIPEGVTAYLVLAFSMVGILALLLLYPIQERTRWVRLFSKGFHFSLFPVILLLGMAIAVRIGQYGLTENRYFVVLLALWLTGIALYFSLKKAPRIRYVPISLFLIALLASFGPWGASYVSERAQAARLGNKLEEYKEPKSEEGSSLSGNEVHEVREIVRYLLQYHGPQSVDPIFSEDLDSIFKEESLYHYHERTDRVTDLLVREKASSPSRTKEQEEKKLTREVILRPLMGGLKGLDVSSYDRIHQLDVSFSDDDPFRKNLRRGDGEFLHLYFHKEETPDLRLISPDSAVLKLNLEPFMKKVIEEGGQDLLRRPLSFMRSPMKGTKGAKGELVIERMEFKYDPSEQKGRVIDLRALILTEGSGNEARASSSSH